jgi:hypothetical protein
MVGAYAGGRVAKFLPASVLLVGFTLMMFVTSLAMMRRRHESPITMQSAAPIRAAAIGVGIGILTGVVGAGGGFVIVPALVLLSGLPMQAAVGTSLLVISMNSFAGFAGTLGHASIHWSLAIAVTFASVTGSLVGAALVGQVKPESLRKGFAWFVLAMAMFMTVKLFPTGVTIMLLQHLQIVVVGTIAFVLLSVILLVRSRLHRPQARGVTLSPLRSETRS